MKNIEKKYQCSFRGFTEKLNSNYFALLSTHTHAILSLARWLPAGLPPEGGQVRVSVLPIPNVGRVVEGKRDAA